MTTDTAVRYDPYDYAMHEDPYPTYERLREEAPVYRNEQRDFYALSRHADVMAGFQDLRPSIGAAGERYVSSHQQRIRSVAKRSAAGLSQRADLSAERPGCGKRSI